MEKISFNDLKVQKPLKIKFITINNKNIEIKQYLPINEKLKLITNVLSQVAQNEYPFANPVQMEVYTTLEILYYYTNIDFSEEAKADPAQLCDELVQQEIVERILDAIPISEYTFIIEGVEKTIEAYYVYRNSIKGIIEDITTDYKNLNLDATEIQEKLADPDNIALLKDVMKKLG